MIISCLRSYKNIIKYNGYILEDVRYIQQRLRDILCICRYHKLEEREPSPCTINEGGGIDEQEEEKERAIDHRS
jgi:hypothetical protein